MMGEPMLEATRVVGGRADARVTARAADLADRAAAIAPVDPEGAMELARHALHQARAEGDLAAASTAERALGHASSLLRSVNDGIAHLRRAIRIAEGAALPEHAALARVVLVGALVWKGDPAAALAEAELAEPDVRK